MHGGRAPRRPSPQPLLWRNSQGFVENVGPELEKCTGSSSAFTGRIWAVTREFVVTSEMRQSVGEIIKEQRETRGLSIAKAASAARVDARWWSRLERGLYQNPDPRSLNRVAKVLELETTELFVAAHFSDGLPSFAPYLRSRYDLPPDAVRQLQAHFELLEQKYTGGNGGRHERRHKEAA
jgi:transcriptional regulator with XRE-family HTH domain